MSDKRRDAPIYTPLMKAAAQGDEDRVSYLLEIAKGTHLNNETAILPRGAAEDVDHDANNWEGVNEEPVDLFMKDRRGRTALDWARLGRHSSCARLLEEAMTADIEKKRKDKEK